jgi:hypothetical protein
MDAFVGGLAEDHVENGAVGELFATIICDQFHRLKNGDRHWYENKGVSGNEELMNKIKHGDSNSGIKNIPGKGITMANVIERNSQLNSYDRVWDGHHSGERSVFLVPISKMNQKSEL